MGINHLLDLVISQLDEAGIPAQRGYPNTMVQIPEQPVAAITVEGSTMKQVQFGVWIFGPGCLGGTICEDAAQRAAEVLRKKRFGCSVGPCRFDGKIDMFSVKILTEWKVPLVDSVQVNEKLLGFTTAFSAVQTRQVEQVTDEETGKVSVVNEEVIWTIAIQELLPFREAVEVERKDAFTLTVTHENCTEIYPQCYWLSITLEETEEGILRKRIARSWTERIVEYTGE